MRESYKLNYLIVTLALALPIIVFVASPGTSGIPISLMSLIIFFNYIYMQGTGFVPDVKLDVCFFLFLCCILFGSIITITTTSFDKRDYTLFIIHLLSWLPVVMALMVKDTTSVLLFTKSYLLVFVPCALYSWLFYSGFGLYDVPHILDKLCLFLMLSVFFPKRYQLILLIVMMIGPIYDVSARASLLVSIFGILFFLFAKFVRRAIVKRVIKLMRILFFIVPIVFLLLGAFSSFNIFQELESKDMSDLEVGTGRKSETRTINIDSRTEVYQDVVYSIETPFDLLFGKGVIIHLNSFWTSQRNSVEVGILNIFLRYGLIGCLVLFILLWRVSKKGVYESNNLFAMTAGLYVAFRFAFAFLEDPSLDPVIYIGLGICLNPEIRQLSDYQVRCSLKSSPKFISLV